MTVAAPDPATPLTAATFPAFIDVPRETLTLLERYAALLEEAQRTHNLVGASTLPELWTRHIADSAQLFALAPPEAIWLDMGTGAGLPGLVLAILGARVHLVEATCKKCAFLAHARAELGLETRATVHCARLEALAPFPVDVITARALKALPQLFDWGLPFAAKTTEWLLLKGAQVEDELVAARTRFRFEAELIPSRTSPGGRIVRASKVARRRPR